MKRPVLRPHRPATLQRRLALSAMIVTAASVLVLTAGFDVLLSHRLDAEAHAVLRARAATISGAITATASGQLTVPEREDDATLDAGIWIYQGQTAVERPPGSARLQRGADRLAGTDGRTRRDGGPKPVEYLSVPVRAGGRQVGTVVAAVPLTPYRSSIRTTLLASALLAALLIAAVYVVTRAAVGQALTPVAAMTRQAAEWSATDATLRFGDRNRPGELAALASTLDGLLDRLAAVLRREQQLSAELSHELRTPLAGITAEAELFATRPRSGPQALAAMERVSLGARRMDRILDSLLAAARLSGDHTRGRCAPAAAVAAVLDDVRPVAKDRGIELRVIDDIADTQAGLDVEVVERILAPVVDNAVRYAVSEVLVQLRRTPQAVVIEVRDDGPGLPEPRWEDVFEPGLRLQPDDGHDGAGLGLALARRLARAGSGDITMVAASAFAIRLPPG